jgi:hypothetical protein
MAVKRPALKRQTTGISLRSLRCFSIERPIRYPLKRWNLWHRVDCAAWACQQPIRTKSIRGFVP